ncbi:HupE/UreJ family protein [Fibrella aquatica]|uniref:HupE/UreJ family protein n=1 Tax=Fibrella aquatica TaxID=3242487 RepID=UPI00351FAEC5
MVETKPFIGVLNSGNGFMSWLMRSFAGSLGLLLAISFVLPVAAHPMPNSVVLLRVHTNRIEADVQIPLSELQAAVGQGVDDDAAGLVERRGAFLRSYLTQHLRVQTADQRTWHVRVGTLAVQETTNSINGLYRELVAQVELLPPAGISARQFVLYYDAVLHQVVTHKVLVSVQQDWERGLVETESPVQVGVIELDIVNNRINPLRVNLATGSTWQGFRAMLRLGVDHIAEGTDHLLFLLVLLLPAPLLVQSRRWGAFGGTRYSVWRILKIVTAFTLGHSLTLLAGVVAAQNPDWVRIPSQPVEVLIAVSILVSAVHALRPLFPGREGWVAAGFGLVHGLAFADTLTNLRLDAGPMALSLLGFNLGIEAMQLVIIALTLPWLLLLSRTPIYSFVRVGGALLATLAAVAWVFERISGQANAITNGITRVAPLAPYGLAALALLAVTAWYINAYGVFKSAAYQACRPSRNSVGDRPVCLRKNRAK